MRSSDRRSPLPNPLPAIPGEGTRSRSALAAFFAVVLFCFVGFAPAAVKVDALENLPVLDNGRVKPLDTLARETVRFVTNRETLEAAAADGSRRKLGPLDAMLAWHDDRVYWADVPLIYVPNLELRTKLGMDASAKYISPNTLAADKAFDAWTTELHRRAAEADKTGELNRFTRLEDAAMEAARRLGLFDAAADGRLTALVPTADPGGRWASVADLHVHPGEASQIPPVFAAVGTAWHDIETAYHAGDQAAFDSAVTGLHARIADAGGKYADQSRIDREVAYNGVKPFRIVWIAYLFTLMALVASLLVKKTWVYAAAMAMLIGTIGVHGGAFAFRCSITGWAPVTNIYETVIWVALTAAVFAAVLELIYRSRTIAIGGATTALITSVIADVMPPEYGHQLRNLTPVLRSNYWLIIHVLTIVSSYAAFALACVLGNIVLVQYMLKNRPAEAIRQNLLFVYRSVQFGVLLVAAGTILGGLWADVSWGRFWGWDPKEVWALIILLTYLALLHGRFAGWVGPFGLAAGSVLCFVTVLMSWYGVNFILGVGLHAYGFGAGGQAYVGAYVVAQLAFVCVAKWIHSRRGRETKQKELPANVVPAAAAS